MSQTGYRQPVDPDQERLDALRKQASVIRAVLEGEAFRELSQERRERIEALEIELATQAKTDRGKLSEDTLNDYERELAHAHDLVNQYEARKLRKEVFGPNWDVRGRALRFVATLALSGAAIFSLTKLPACLVERASKDASDCFDAFDDGSHDDPMACRQRLTLLWPSVVPWKRKAAVDESNDILSDALQRAMTVATAGDLDAGRRSEIAAQAAELEPDDRYRILVGGGDLDAIARLDPLPEDKTALTAALALGDVERARQLAAMPSRSYEATLRRGAWLCLIGERDAGLGALAAADAQYGSVISGPTRWFDARAAAHACGAPANEYALVPSYGRRAMQFVRLLDPSWQKGRRLAVADALLAQSGYGERHERLAAAALWLGGARPSALEAHKRLATGNETLGVREQTLATPFALLRHGDLHDQPIFDPSWLESGAAALEKLAATPIEPSPDRSPEAVAAELRRAAFVLWLEAGAYQAREGWTDRAKRSAARAVKIAPEGLEWVAAAVLLAIGDAAGAQKLVMPVIKRADFAKAPARDRSLAYLQLAWAETSLGKWDEALAHARLAHAATRSVDTAIDKEFELFRQRAGISDLGIRSNLSARTGWLLAALMLRAGKVESIEGLPSPPDDIDAMTDPLAVLSGFLRLASLPDAERRRQRMKLSPLSWMGETIDALPAALFVVGAAAGKGDVEVWLDRMCALELLSDPEDMRLWMRARAEAAQWRGDEAAAKRWNDRRARLDGVVKDPRTAVIAHAGGL